MLIPTDGLHDCVFLTETKGSAVRFLLLVPLLVTLAYYAFLSPVLYRTQTVLVVEKPDSRGSGGGVFTGPDGRNEGNYLFQAFVLSYEEFRALRANVNLAEAYDFTDPVQSFGGVLSLFSHDDHALYRYYDRYIVDIDVGKKNGLVQFTLRAPSAALAERLTGQILGDARARLAHLNVEPDDLLLHEHEASINRIRQVMAHDEQVIADNILSSGIYEGSGFYDTVLKTQFRLMEDQAALKGRQAALQEDVDHAAQAMHREVMAYEGEQEVLRQRSVTPRHVILENDRLIREVRSLSSILDAEMAACETVRTNAIMGHYFLKTVSGPVVEDTPLRPAFWWSSAIALVAGLVLYVALA
ncbi:hypothetical protein DTQ13_03745 [Parasaccharibacter sp. TMW 2.1888]|nr:hypothetical protein DTQ13_03745 [Parasaccharibacter sp. TMW 2.1888]